MTKHDVKSLAVGTLSRVPSGFNGRYRSFLVCQRSFGTDV